jgi:hypothetical protein
VGSAELVAKLDELTGPVMSPATRLQRHHAARLSCEEIQQLSSADPLAEYRSPPVIHSMCVENMFSDIQTDCDNF